jgi:transcriptional regulator with XRE-family HTH domain
MNALQRLIVSRMKEQGWSYNDVARRGGLPRSTVHHLATSARLVHPPNPNTLEGLARGLDLPLSAMRAAAAEAAGLSTWAETGFDPEIQILVAGLTRLTPGDRRHVQALIASLLNGYPGTDVPTVHEGEDPTSTGGSNTGGPGLT